LTYDAKWILYESIKIFYDITSIKMVNQKKDTKETDIRVPGREDSRVDKSTKVTKEDLLEIISEKLDLMSDIPSIGLWEEVLWNIQEAEKQEKDVSVYKEQLLGLQKKCVLATLYTRFKTLEEAPEPSTYIMVAKYIEIARSRIDVSKYEEKLLKFKDVCYPKISEDICVSEED
jgi:hypothetical protein